MENLLALERKSLADLVACTVSSRQRFLAACARLSGFAWKAILVEATFEDIKGGIARFDIPSDVHPNAVCGTLDAIEAKFGIPIILRFHGARAFHGACRQLAFKALYLLVAGTALPRPGTDRCGWTLK